MTTLNDTPSANRLHIGFFGKRNSGKSSLINAFTGQEVSIVSEVAGTTTDPVHKAMELRGLGACVLIDTAGFDDVGGLGEIRVEKTRKAAERTDIAIILFAGMDFERELEWFRYFKTRNTPVIPVISKADASVCTVELNARLEKELSVDPLVVSAVTGEGMGELRERLIRAIPEGYEMSSITGSLVRAGDTVLLVMPQDLQAPKGRLILPQVQTIRDLLDKKCLVLCATTDNLDNALASLNVPPRLIITDSQVFREVYMKKPKESRLTSFSVLFAAYKGDLGYYLDGVRRIEQLSSQSKVLIAECCTHAPLEEDIGRVKIPGMLRKRAGGGLAVDVCSGTDFPEDLMGYDLIIQCGGCMFNRKYILSRIDRAREQNIPMTNYGVAMAYLSGILEDISMN